jgi:predicted component of type VI protein secretion system
MTLKALLDTSYKSTNTDTWAAALEQYEERVDRVETLMTAKLCVCVCVCVCLEQYEERVDRVETLMTANLRNSWPHATICVLILLYVSSCSMRSA